MPASFPRRVPPPGTWSRHGSGAPVPKGTAPDVPLAGAGDGRRAGDPARARAVPCRLQRHIARGPGGIRPAGARPGARSRGRPLGGAGSPRRGRPRDPGPPGAGPAEARAARCLRRGPAPRRVRRRVIDLHSHLLPAVDDGSRSVAQSVKVMKEQVARGVTDICLTPHVRAGDLAKSPPEAHETAYAALQAAALPLPRLYRGAEVMLDRPLPPNPPNVRRFTIGGTRYLL